MVTPFTARVTVSDPETGALVQRFARMPGERKLSDEDVARLRHLAMDEGWSHTDLALAFDVTPQHVGRLVRGEQRPTIAGLDADALRDGGVSAAVDAFLEDVELGAGDQVLAAAARALARKLDGCSTSTASSSAQAVPRLAQQLVDVLERLTANMPREPDTLDRLRQRRQARLLALAANGAGDNSTGREQ
jgi:transcriptional regulator with XRE-family HTH domain